MKITEILVESKQLDEGPLLNKIGDVVGKSIGGVGKGIGAVAGGVAGLGTAIKKGYRAGKATVAGGGDDEEQSTSAAPATTTAAPVKSKGDSATMQGVKSGINKALGAKAFDVDSKVPSAQQAAKPSQAGATSAPPVAPKQQAAGPQTDTSTVATPKPQSAYAQVKTNIDKLDKKGKQRILQLLQKSLGQSAAVQPTTTEPTTTTPAVTQPAVDAKAPARRGRNKVSKPSQAEIDADRARIMGDQMDSIARTAKPISESFSLYRKQ